MGWIRAILNHFLKSTNNSLATFSRGFCFNPISKSKLENFVRPRSPPGRPLVLSLYYHEVLLFLKEAFFDVYFDGNRGEDWIIFLSKLHVIILTFRNSGFLSTYFPSVLACPSRPCCRAGTPARCRRDGLPDRTTGQHCEPCPVSGTCPRRTHSHLSEFPFEYFNHIINTNALVPKVPNH